MNKKETSPIRVLHILGSVQCGGVETVIFNNYRAIDKTKVQFDIIIDKCSPYKIPTDILALGAIVYEVPSYVKLFSYINTIRRICRQNNYQIVHSHMNAMSVFSLFAAWLAKVPVRIAHSHSTAGRGNDFKRDIIKYILRPFAKIFATHYFACSKHAACWLFGQKELDKNRVTILNNAISTAQFRFQPQIRNVIREQLGINNKFVVGHVGRLSPPKNHLFLIQVFANLYRLREDSVLILIGGSGSAGSGIESKLHKIVNESEFKDKVFFLGACNDISKYYQAMDIFILPSLYEGLGIACIEAQCSGLPCVLSDRVPKEVQVTENVCFLPLEKPVMAWAKVISRNNVERHNCSEQVVQAGYDIMDTVKQLEQFYLTCIPHSSKNSEY